MHLMLYSTPLHLACCAAPRSPGYGSGSRYVTAPARGIQNGGYLRAGSAVVVADRYGCGGFAARGRYRPHTPAAGERVRCEPPGSRVPCSGAGFGSWGSTRVSWGFNSGARSFWAISRGPAAPPGGCSREPAGKCCLACRGKGGPPAGAANRPRLPGSQDRSAGRLPARQNAMPRNLRGTPP